ncbi:juvenile hormone acid O-methyltransferase [Stomoxys calcitrans]|uniref:juvenile hormone acid O-methyltransferase n=1 Tax=Stomoxys calcitrans TaxID=35570 RepID=UPI0027E330E3|nr:juvenile hormone acid O-methyltransferase [Stomoxys calcitrans]
MNSPNLYQKARKAQTEDASQFLEEFFPKLNWRPDGHDSLIDIGSGTGDLLYDLVHSRMPQSVERIVCSDINPNMIKFAQETYGTESKWEFQILDIENKEGFVEDFRGTFDHLTSFYVLHWTKSLSWLAGHDDRRYEWLCGWAMRIYVN